MGLDFLHLNFRRRIAALVWARRIIVVVAIVSAFFLTRRWWSAVLLLLGAFAFAATLNWLEASLRRQFVREARLPNFLAGRLRAAHPQLSHRDTDLVLRGLRQFFMAHLRSGRRFVAMPSKVVDNRPALPAAVMPAATEVAVAEATDSRAQATKKQAVGLLFHWRREKAYWPLPSSFASLGSDAPWPETSRPACV